MSANPSTNRYRLTVHVPEEMAIFLRTIQSYGRFIESKDEHHEQVIIEIEAEDLWDARTLLDNIEDEIRGDIQGMHLEPSKPELVESEG